MMLTSNITGKRTYTHIPKEDIYICTERIKEDIYI